MVFTHPPLDQCGGVPAGDLVKRVIALPGESFSTHGGGVYINGRPLKEPYLQKGVQTCAPNTGASGCGDVAATKIPAGDILVLGDNRPASKDSRFFGPIKESSIVGRVFVRIWPLNDLGLL